MADTSATGKYYTLRHIALISGLSERTLRNDIHLGLLQGEKINGLWHFTPEQVEAFMRHPAVRPGIKAHQTSLVGDFLLDTAKPSPQACLILDLPHADKKKTAEFFCYEISTNQTVQEISFSFDSLESVPRVILRGKADQVMALAQHYFSLHPQP